MTAPSGRIVQFWHQATPPHWVLSAAEAMQAVNPGHEYELFNARMAMDFIAKEFDSGVLRAFRDIRLPAMLSDVFRIAWILKKGGTYIDMAARCTSPIDSWISRDPGLVLLVRKELGWPYANNTFIYSSDPGHPVVAEVWQAIEEAIVRRSGESVWETTGPGVFGRVFSRQPDLYRKFVIPLESVGEHVRLGSSAEFLPMGQHWSVRQKTEKLYEPDGIIPLLMG